MNEEINWDDAPEGYDLHIHISDDTWKAYCVSDFARDLENGMAELKTGDKLNLAVCRVRWTVTERPQEEHSLTEEDSLQGQLSHIGDLLHNLSCSMENEVHQEVLGDMVTQLWSMSKMYKQTPEQRLRAKVWDVVAETGIRESDIDAITTNILEKFNLEEK